MDKEKAAQAMGALVTFYRRIRGQNQIELAKKAGMSNSQLAMAESGHRMLGRCLGPIVDALGLSTLTRQQLQALRGTNSHLYEGEATLLPEDILTGSQLFLRTLHDEFSGEHRENIDELWIVTGGDLLSEKNLKSFLVNRGERTKFVFFVGSNALSLATNVQLMESLLPEKNFRIVCVPSGVCLQDMLIYNPGKPFRMFGRAVVYLQSPFGTYAIDSFQVAQAYQFFELILIHTEVRPGVPAKTSVGECTLLV